MRTILTRLALVASLTLALVGLAAPATALESPIPHCENIREGGCQPQIPLVSEICADAKCELP